MAAINDTARPESLLTGQIKKEIEKLPGLPDNPSIYRIPKNLRSVNEKAYTPCRVAIGPYHAHDPALMPMNHYKLKCLDSLISRNTNQLEDYVEAIASEEDKARKYYAGIEYLSSDDFVRMLLIDGAFIIEFLCKFGEIHSSNRYLDVVFTNIRIRSEIVRDLIVLENQLPYIILERLYKLIYGEEMGPFIFVVYDALSNMVPFKTGTKIFKTDKPAVIWRIDVPEIFKEGDVRRRFDTQIMHFVHFMILCTPSQKETDMNALSTVDTPDDESYKFLSATELHEAGVKIEKIVSDKHLLLMKFSNGVLEIPDLV